MTPVGQIEKRTQERVVRLFRDTLGYGYLGNWIEREGNRNIEEEVLRTFLKGRGYDDVLINRALYDLDKAAGDQSRRIYGRSKAVYELLRAGVKVKPQAGATPLPYALIHSMASFNWSFWKTLTSPSMK